MHAIREPSEPMGGDLRTEKEHWKSTFYDKRRSLSSL